MAKILISGSSGFIGSHLKGKLINYDIIKLDLNKGIDVTNFNSLESIKSFDVAIHLAAKTFVPYAYNDPLSFYHTNIQGTLNMLELCRLNNAKIIFVSSYVYGNPDYLPINEEHPVKSFNPYAQSKIIGEELCKSYCRDFNMSAVIFRLFNPYGIGQDDHFIIPKIIKQAVDGAVYLDDPLPKRDFIYIDDLVDAFIKAIEYERAGCEIFNIGSGCSYGVSELARIIINEFNSNAILSFSGKKRINEVYDTVADITKAKSELKWVPHTTINAGIRKIKNHLMTK